MDTRAVEDQPAERLGGVGADEDGDAHLVHQGDAVVGDGVRPGLSEQASEFDGVLHHDQGLDGDLLLVAHLLYCRFVQGLLDGRVGDVFPPTARAISCAP